MIFIACSISNIVAMNKLLYAGLQVSEICHTCRPLCLSYSAHDKNFYMRYFIVSPLKLTCATDVVMMVPPAAPIVIKTFPFLSSTIAGTAEDCGLLPGLMKLTGDGGSPNSFVTCGALKSSISLL